MTSNQFHNGTSYSLVGDPHERPVVVLVHGVGLNQKMWHTSVDLLSKEYSVLTYDFLGHGESLNPPGQRVIRDYVDQLSDLMSHIGVARFALAGFSMGALISQAFASLYPQWLTHLALLHSVYQRTDAQCHGVRDRYQLTLDEGPMATLELALDRWFSQQYRQDHPEVMDQIRAIFSAHTDDGYPKAYFLFANAEAEMRQYTLVNVRCPALVITGSGDIGSTPDMSKALGRDLPNARVIINPGHRHMAPVEHADIVTGQLISLFSVNDWNNN